MLENQQNYFVLNLHYYIDFCTWVGYKSIRCKECQAEVTKRQNRESYLRKKEGTTRKIGSEAICQRCGRTYIVRGAAQKYCDNCAGIMFQEKAKERNASKKITTNPLKNE